MAEETDAELSPYVINDVGRFCFVFSDEETAKEMVSTELKHVIYPYLYVLSEEERTEWNLFVDEMKKQE